jgi:nucleotide-binding universal stress UspA family protein
MNHLLAAVDGSDGSRRAAHWAAELARRTDAKLTLLLVLEPAHLVPFVPLEAFAVTKPAATPEAVAKATAFLDEVKRDLPQGQADEVVEIGRPADVILAWAQREGVDHVVLGARGVHSGGRWSLGSVSDRVVHHAHCPVTVVR